MRSAFFAVTLLLIATLSFMPSSSAQLPDTHYIILYAHSSGKSQILNALPQWAGQKTLDISKGILFRMSPALGTSLRIEGTITATIWLKGNQLLSGTAFVEVSELKSTGEEIPVTGKVSKVPAKMNSFVSLDTLPVPFTLGVGIIDYKFERGSSVLLHIRFETQTAGVPYLVWDDADTSTNLTIPAVSLLSAQIFSFVGQERQGSVIQVDNITQRARISLLTNITDAFGIYRLSNALVTLTAPNGTARTSKVTPKAISDYVAINSFNLTLDTGQWRIGLELRDLVGTDKYRFTDAIWVAPFYAVRLNIGDSSGLPLQNASVNVSFGQDGIWSGFTNATGWSTLVLPSSTIVGLLNVSVTWRDVQTQPPSLNVVGETTIFLRLSVYNVNVRITMYGLPVPYATVKLVSGGKVIAQATTGLDGSVPFNRITAGTYTLIIQYFFTEYHIAQNIKDAGPITVRVPFVSRRVLLVAALAVAGVVTLGIVHRRRTKLYPKSFSHFDKLTTGGLPQTCFALIAGNSGSGKTVLLETLATQHLGSGGCVFITNTEYPARIRENMATLGMWAGEEPDKGKIRFIDAYSAIGGASSNEAFYVSSHTDLTDLGLKISRCLEETGHATDVYLDSLNPLLSALRIEYLLNFLQSIAAKVKANDGKLCVTVGTGIEKSDLVKLEEVVDCVIETQLQELKKGQKKRLRIKKLRGKPYIDKWTTFQIETGKGIIFYSRAKP